MKNITWNMIVILFFDVNEYLELNIDINKNKLSINNNEIKQ